MTIMRTHTAKLSHRGQALDGAGASWARSMMARIHQLPAERRLDLAWTWIGVIVGGGSIWLGAGYAVSGDRATRAQHGWYYVSETIGLRTHGIIMCVLGAALLLMLRGEYTRWGRWVLRLLRTYSLFIAIAWFGSWAKFGASWSAPVWWVLLAGLTVWMTYFAPPIRERGGRA